MKSPEPHVPPEYSKAVAAAFKSLAAGTAEPHQQETALNWLLDSTGLKDLSYRPGDTHATAFAEGKRFVGLQVAKMLTITPTE